MRDNEQKAPADDGRGLSEQLGAWIAPNCWCHTCRPVRSWPPGDMRMVLCPDCGNKLCPHANDHRNACTGSNEPGQPGSAYPGLSFCPHCGQDAQGWTHGDLVRGWRMKPGLKEYHCRHAAVAD